MFLYRGSSISSFFVFALAIVDGALTSLPLASSYDVYERPVIGVLTQEFIGDRWDQQPYIAASYVKFVESGGARVVPIDINRNDSYYHNLLDQLNGVLFPGGDVDVHNSGYGRAGQLIYDYAKQRNEAGDYFPLWGICNGFEMLIYLSVDDYVLTACDSHNQAKPLHFLPDTYRSRLFGKNLPGDVLNYLTHKNTTINFHRWCLTPQNFIGSGVNKVFNQLATNKDINGIEFVSALEAKAYPFYGVQFHPEKNLFEWTTRANHNNIPHSAEAIRVAQYFAEFFVNETRKSKHRMREDFFAREAIYNYNPEYTQDQLIFTQTYFFK
ncbi:gamma-glutamyl hydrolase-like [Varroa jacobsoni]|uniref:gamma-glutamyl hydrolase-like n=1 Tax=Varroa jacobsoni TaxID=62625 RepID=UPI000BF29642|nr:gamma-glutamyl hydrolase-like [Varroa jacobsoni]